MYNKQHMMDELLSLFNNEVKHFYNYNPKHSNKLCMTTNVMWLFNSTYLRYMSLERCHYINLSEMYFQADISDGI